MARRRTKREHQPVKDHAVSIREWLSRPSKYVTRWELWQMLEWHRKREKRRSMWRRVLRWIKLSTHPGEEQKHVTEEDVDLKDIASEGKTLAVAARQ